MKNDLTNLLRLVSAAIALLMVGGCATSLLSPPVPDIADYLNSSDNLEMQANVEEAVVADTPLTLSACVRIALADNPLGQAAREGVAVARENIGIERSHFYPQVSLTGSYHRWESRAFLPDSLNSAMTSTHAAVGPTDDWSVGGVASFNLFDSGRRRTQLLAAKARWKAQQAELATVEQDIALNVHRAF